MCAVSAISTIGSFSETTVALKLIVFVLPWASVMVRVALLLPIATPAGGANFTVTLLSLMFVTLNIEACVPPIEQLLVVNVVP